MLQNTTNILLHYFNFKSCVLIVRLLLLTEQKIMPLDVSSSHIREYVNKRFQAVLVDSLFSLHQRESHILACVDEGEIVLEYRERHIVLSTGQTVFIPAGEMHSFQSNNLSEAKISFSYIDTVTFLKAAQWQVLLPTPYIETFSLSANGFANSLFTDLNKPVSECEMNTYISTFIKKLPSNLFKPIAICPSDFDKYESVKHYVQLNWAEIHSLDSLAARFEIDRWQLSRNFKLLFGISLFQLIHAVRIVEAKNLLSKNVPLADVAYSCRFSDQSHFTRMFKRFVGISPNQWAKWVKTSNNRVCNIVQ